jgi:vancomycin aglycone glucosyltransferase
MRVLLSTIGSRGDVQPLVALALQLRGLGHDVRLCVPPDFREWIEGFGLSVTPIGPEVRGFAAQRATPSPPSPEQIRQLIADSVATQFTTLTAAAKGYDVILAATALQVAARSVAETLGIAYVFAAYSPTVFPSSHHAPPPLPPVPGKPVLPPTTDNRELWARSAARFQDTFGAALNAHRTALGLPVVNDVRGHMFGDRAWLAADPTLAPWPDRGDDAVLQTGAWILQDERPLSPDVEQFLQAGDPPIYFGFGSSRVPQDLSHLMVEVAHRLRRRAIVSRGWSELSVVENDPDCLIVGEVNLLALFPRVAAIVHHGGAGTTTTAALAGVPQVVVPQVYDQHYFAQRVRELGIGCAHAAGAPGIDSLTDALEQALTPDVSGRAESVAAAMRRDGALIAAQHLTEHLQRA